MEHKQYLVMVDEIGMACLRTLIPSISCAEIQAMNVETFASHQLLVTPKKMDDKIDKNIVDNVGDGLVVCVNDDIGSGGTCGNMSGYKRSV